ncbi:DNA polymerase III subunit delta [Patescibacteria group bacterium]|nr:DNA polymerase III subunit delta [Patescibacteria group bacterium]
MQNLILWHGDDLFSLQKELARWRKAFLEKPGGDMNLEELDGNSSLPNLKNSLRALPFLAEKRLVILKNFMADQNADTQRDLIPSLENLPETTVLLMVEMSQPDKRTALYKFLAQAATAKAFTKPKGPLLTGWIIKQAQSHKSQIDSSSASYLASLIGDNLFRLDNEIQKLALYSEGKQISIPMIDELVSSSTEQSIFLLTDQLAKKDIKSALATLSELLNQGNEVPYLFAMIARQFRLMLEMKSLSENRIPQNVIASKMKVHPFVVKTTQSQCRNFTYGQLKRGLKQLLEIDKRLKNGQIHFRQTEPEQYILALERVLINTAN